MSDYLHVRVADCRFLVPLEIVASIDTSEAKVAAGGARVPRVVDARRLIGCPTTSRNRVGDLIELAGVAEPGRRWVLVDQVERFESFHDRQFFSLPPSLRFLADFIDAALVEDDGARIALRVRRRPTAPRLSRGFARAWRRAIVSLSPKLEEDVAR